MDSNYLPTLLCINDKNLAKTSINIKTSWPACPPCPVGWVLYFMPWCFWGNFKLYVPILNCPPSWQLGRSLNAVSGWPDAVHLVYERQFTIWLTYFNLSLRGFWLMLGVFGFISAFFRQFVTKPFVTFAH